MLSFILLMFCGWILMMLSLAECLIYFSNVIVVMEVLMLEWYDLVFKCCLIFVLIFGLFVVFLFWMGGLFFMVWVVVFVAVMVWEWI